MKLQYPYYALLIASFIYSLYFLHHKMVKVLAIWFLLSIVTEVLAEVKIANGSNFFIFYHVFTLSEYAMLSVVLYWCIRDRLIKYLLLLSIPAFALLSLLAMLFFQDSLQMPTISRGLEGTLLIIWCVRAFYDIKAETEVSLFQQAPFWFIMAFYSYYCIITPYNCVFNTLKADPHYKVLATRAYDIINCSGNYLLYILCIIGLSCLKRARFTRQ